jgi:hypothetical protein
VFFLTNAMARLLDRVSIPLRDLAAIETYHQKLTYNEIGQILKFQHRIAQELGVPMLDPEMLFKKDYEGGMLKEAFNSVDGESLSEFINSSASFSYLNSGANVLVFAFNTENDDKLAGWTELESATFSGALLECIFNSCGYLESHFGKIVEPALGEFSLAVVYKLLGLQNP